MPTDIHWLVERLRNHRWKMAALLKLPAGSSPDEAVARYRKMLPGTIHDPLRARPVSERRETR